MKILITSDIHRDIKKLEEVLKKEKDISYHLDAGDSNFPTNFLEEKNILSVKGNTDFFVELPLIRLLEIDNKKILIVHGHTLKVKKTKDLLYSYAKGKKVDICIYGHTHIQDLEEKEDIIFINPGSVKDKRYAIYENGKIKLY